MRRNSIDMLKLIAAYFVIVLHNTDNTEIFQLNFQSCARFAVPVFLLISGYFIADIEGNKLKAQIKKVFIYYIKYEALYIGTEFILDLLNHNLCRFEMLIAEEAKEFLIAPIIATHLWYLINIVWVYVIIYIFKKIKKMKLLFCISIVCEVAGLILANLSVILFGAKLSLAFTRNFLFYALFIVLIGMLIKKRNIEKYNISATMYLALGIIFFALQPLERMLWDRLFLCEAAECYLTSFMCSVLLFLGVLKMNLKSKVIEKIAFLSGYIYFLHPLVMRLFSTSLRRLTGREVEIFKTSLLTLIVYCLFIYAATALLVIIFENVSNKISKIVLCK